MSQVTGIIQEVNNRGRSAGSSITVNGNRYGAFDPVKVGMDGVAVGEEVTFGTSVNGSYTNIQGMITKTGVTGTPSAPPPAKGGTSYSKGKAGGGRPWPVPLLDGQRSIIRQNSLSHATALVNQYHQMVDSELPVQDRVEEVLRIARIFTEFSSGDDITAAAEQAEKDLGTSGQ